MTRRKEYYFLRFFLFICLTLFWLPDLESQVRLSKKKHGNQTRAVVVGISNYQNISDLAYAHRDAQVFGQFLRSKAGGQLPADNLRLLTDSTATLAAIKSAFDWLVNQSNSGDRAIIYFAGHGDVEKKDSIARGYLLAHDSPFNNYHLNAISVQDLDEIIQTLSVKKGVEVVLISDACRSGNLAGNQFNGANLTAEEMAKFDENSILIMSCQPEQLSEEGRQWGGGRGAFSYHLINGWVGMADKLPKDKKVRLLELDVYLKQEVPLSTDQQLPKIEGNRMEELGRVDVDVLEFVLKASDRSSSLLEYDIESELSSDDESDSLSLVYENKMLTALQKGALLQPKGDCAYDYFKLLKQRNFGRLDDLKSKLTIALQDEAQQALNAYLNSDPEELNNRWNYDEKYSRFPRYLETAAEILGSYDKYYAELMAKKYYFDGLILRLQGEKESNTTTAEQLFRLGLSMQKQALEQENLSAFIYNELGLLHKRLEEYDEAIPYFEKAIELSPSWVMAYNNLATIYFLKKDFDTAEAFGMLAVELDSNLAYSHRTLGQALYRNKKYTEAEKVLLRAIALNPTYAPIHYTLGNMYKKPAIKNIERSKYHYEKAIEIDPDYVQALNNLGTIYLDEENYAEAEKLAQRTIEIKRDYTLGYLKLARIYAATDRPGEAESILQRIIEIKPTDYRGYNRLGDFYIQNNQFEKAEKIFLLGIEKAPSSAFYFNIAGVYLYMDEPDKAKSYFQQYIELEKEDPDGYFMMACTLALEGKENNQIDTWLEKARQKNFKYWEGLLLEDVKKQIEIIPEFKSFIQ